MKKNSIHQSLSYDKYHIKHNQKIQTLPGPTITIINMAVERIADDPNWEEANPFVIQYDRHDDLLPNPKNNQSLRIKQAPARHIITNDSSLFQKNVKHEKQPNIYIDQSNIQNNNKYSSNPNKKVINHKSGANFHQIFVNNDINSTSSELSGHDSESIYETIRVFTPKKKSLGLFGNEDEYKTADIDEFEVEIKDLIRLQKANNTYNDILSSNLQNLRSPRSQRETNQIKSRQTRQQSEDNPALFSLLSSHIRYEKQPGSIINLKK